MVFSAITNGPKGLVPVRASNGLAQRSNQYQILGTGSDKFYRGQPLMIGTDGLVIILTASTDTILGVFGGVEYVASAGDIIFKPYWDAPGAVQTGSQVRCTIYDDPQGVFQMYADADLSVARVSDYFKFDTVAGTGGSVVTGQSSLSLDVGATATSPAGYQIQLRGFDVQKGRPSDLRTGLVQFVDPEFAGELGAT